MLLPWWRLRWLRLSADKDHDVRGVTEEAAGARWMRRVNQEFREWNNRLALAEYNFVTNITDDTQEKVLARTHEHT